VIRIRLIQDEMIKLASAHGWLMMEQELGPNPMDIVAEALQLNVHNSTARQQLVLNNQSDRESLIL